MNLISLKPRHWNQVVGQERVLRVVQLALNNQGYLPRGVIFEGPVGVGKTSIAYLFARALMCTGGIALGCGKCGSCQVEFDREGVDHPDLMKVNAGYFSGVEKARELLDIMLQPPAMARRRIVLVDEAHRMSDAAWDSYLEVLEQAETPCMVLYVSSQGSSIPESIQSRSMVLQLDRLTDDKILGVLMARVEERGIQYTLDGLRMIVRHARGNARNAMQYLSIAAMTGGVTPESVTSVVSLDVSAVCAEVFRSLGNNQLTAAIEIADRASLTVGPARFVEYLFGFYAEQIFKATPIAGQFGSLKEMTAFFLKWSQTPYLPMDALPLMLLELNELRPGQSRNRTPNVAPTLPEPQSPRSRERLLTNAEMKKELNIVYDSDPR